MASLEQNSSTPVVARRWELYRVLSEPSRLRLLALASHEELAIGELAELLKESQPNVSRQLKPLRKAGLLSERKNGTRVFIQLADGVAADPVISDALLSGIALCQSEGCFDRVDDVLKRREEPARAFFDSNAELPQTDFPSELPAYLAAIAPLIPNRTLAVDVGTGSGSMLDVLAPIFDSVIAIDRAKAQLSAASERLAARGYKNVSLVESDLSIAELSPVLKTQLAKNGGADATFASRVLHHVGKPEETLRALTELTAPGGAVVVIDYVAHQDERMRDQQADHWLGFDSDALCKMAIRAGLTDPTVSRVPALRCGNGPDGHLDWQIMVARKPIAEAN